MINPYDPTDQNPTDEADARGRTGISGNPDSGKGDSGNGRVWLTAQRSPHAQRAGRFVPHSLAHPARMGPDLAARIIARYSRPGEWVLDPMCGIGTTVVQAVRAGRRAVGLEYEPRWLGVARANLELAVGDGHRSRAHLVAGDARRLRALLPPEVIGQVSLVLTSPPYGSGVHGHVTNRHAGDPIIKRHHRYADTRADRANLAHTTRDDLATAMTEILTQAAAVLRPDGVVVMVVRPWRHRGALIDLPEQLIECAHAAGLVITDRAAALLGRVDDQTRQLVVRASFFARLNLTRSRAAGAPTHLISHEDVLVAERSAAGDSGDPARPLGSSRGLDGGQDLASGSPA